jgi:hypothetical protein
MHYVFRSKATADLIMTGPVGDRMLEIVGKTPAPQGIIEAAAIPEAMRAIERAVASETEAARRTGDGRPHEPSDDAAGQRVGLQQRAWPLLAMMQRALAERADIVWGV